jgi:rRNA processing protein Gar1
LIVVIRSVIQVGVIVRIVGRPINRPGKLLKKDTMVTETTVTKAAVIFATRKSTSRKSPRLAESRTRATTGEPAKCVTESPFGLLV